jgi:hypothetical protein
MNKITLLFNTIKFLKPIQIYTRIFYFVRKKVRVLYRFNYPLEKKSNSVQLNLESTILSYKSYFGERQFNFLNLSKKFENQIDWDYTHYGKLWTYNLNYFDFLNQEEDENHTEIIEEFISQQKTIKVGFDSFPIALRGINWIKYLTYRNIKSKKIDDALYSNYYRLYDNLEYHLLGNHLLENGFSLLFGAYYFEDRLLYKRAKKILIEELEEQILDDGGHFERSVMYHQIMLFRLLDTINLVNHNLWKNQELQLFLIRKAEFMLGWLQQMTYQNGEIPLVNDSTNGIAPSSKELFEYAKRLNIKIKLLPLHESGYRKIVKERYESVVDIGAIGAEYIPGHAHSDTFSFELYCNKKPFIVDTGLSTYETNARRMTERSTLSHNTVEVNGQNQSEVWGGFRVGKRANVVYLKESEQSIEAVHDGYKDLDVAHHRLWYFEEDKVIIEDKLNKKNHAIASLHFHPKVTRNEILNHIVIENANWSFSEYKYASEFNKLEKAISIHINFTMKLKITIKV